MTMMANLWKGSMCNRMVPSLPRKPNMLRTKAHCLLPIWDSIPSLLIRIGILPSADTGHSATMYTIMWLPTSMYNPCTAIRATSPTYCAEPKIPVSRTSSFIRIISWKRATSSVLTIFLWDIRSRSYGIAPALYA